jgi:organic hydroperoxide reductase OsmC/OhrA
MISYTTRATWKSEHWGHLTCSNGADLDFSAPPSLHGHEGVMTPEDATVGALNMCFQMMFLWAAERFRLGLVSYECDAEGFVAEALDQTSCFSRFVLRPRIVVRGSTEARVRQALKAARKYSLVAESLRGEVSVEPEIQVLPVEMQPDEGTIGR